MKKKILSLLLILGLTVGAAGCADSKDTKNTGANAEENQTSEEGALEKVRLGVFTGGPDQYLAVAGQEQGIFEKYGINLAITEFAAGINTVDAIVTGQSDIGMIADFAGINRIGNTQENFNIRIIGRYTTAKSYNLYVNPDEVTKLEDLAGKGFATMPGTILDYYNSLTYEKANIKKEDQRIVNVDSGQTVLSVLESGDAVAFWTAGATAKKLEEAGMKEFLTMDDFGISVDAYYVSSDSYMKNHADILENFLSAVKETEEWVQANQEKAAEIIEEKTGIPQEQILQNLESNQLLLDFKQDSIEHLNGIKEWALDAGLFEKDYEIKDFVDTAILEKLFPNDVAY